MKQVLVGAALSILSVVCAYANGLDEAQKKALLDAHNEARCAVSPPALLMPALVWDPRLEQVAQSHANRCSGIENNLKRTSQYKSIGGRDPVGETIFVSSVDVTGNLEIVVRQWASTKGDYDFATNSCKGTCGNFTQVIWAATTAVGCGLAVCSGEDFPYQIVCNYAPDGNYEGLRPYRSGEGTNQACVATRRARGDFQGDGSQDLLWHNIETGEVKAWLLDGTTLREGVTLLTLDDLEWRIAGLGDLNGDGKTDLIGRHAKTGSVNVWFLDGMKLASETSLFTVADLDWKLEAVGDFNGDGKDDLIWRNYRTGAVNAWFFDGGTFVRGDTLFTVADLDWRIEVAGDFNGDGETDLIWRNHSTGAVNVWLLEGVTYAGGATLFTVEDPAWQLEASGDYNGDGKLDLIWRNYETGEVSAWLLDGLRYIEGLPMATVKDSSWTIAGPR